MDQEKLEFNIIDRKIINNAVELKYKMIYDNNLKHGLIFKEYSSFTCNKDYYEETEKIYGIEHGWGTSSSASCVIVLKNDFKLDDLKKFFKILNTKKNLIQKSFIFLFSYRYSALGFLFSFFKNKEEKDLINNLFVPNCVDDRIKMYKDIYIMIAHYLLNSRFKICISTYKYGCRFESYYIEINENTTVQDVIDICLKKIKIEKAYALKYNKLILNPNDTIYNYEITLPNAHFDIVEKE